MHSPTIPIEQLRPNPKNPRVHSNKQIKMIARSIEEFNYFNPIVVDDADQILAGHGRYEAAKLLGLKEVPFIRIIGLSRARKRALALSDNKLPETARWDRKLLAVEFPELSQLLVAEGLEIGITGFSPPEIDQIAIDLETDPSDPIDDLGDCDSSQHQVSSFGDLWQLGEHRLLCGDARKKEAVVQLLDGALAAAVITDPPYNVRIGSVVGRGATKYPEFRMGSGEMSQSEYRDFLRITLGNAIEASRPGAAHFIFEDWRHIADLIEVGRAIYAEMLNLAVWTKSTPGQGSFYRSQHELIGIFRVAGDEHQNNIQLGRHGRNRSNVWSYPGSNAFGRHRRHDLKLHPTLKPVALIADAIRDCTRRDEAVLDVFAGAGSTLLACERVGRRGCGLELEPRYVDVTIRRWQEFSGRDAVLTATGQTFDQISCAGEQKSATDPDTGARR